VNTSRRFEKLTERSLEQLTRWERFELRLRCRARGDDELREQVRTSGRQYEMVEHEDDWNVQGLVHFLVFVVSQMITHRQSIEVLHEFYEPTPADREPIEMPNGEEFDPEEFDLPDNLMERMEQYDDEVRSVAFFQGVYAMEDYHDIPADPEEQSQDYRDAVESAWTDEQQRQRDRYGRVHSPLSLLRLRFMMKAHQLYVTIQATYDGARDVLEDRGLPPDLVFHAYGKDPLEIVADVEQTALEIIRDYRDTYESTLEQWEKQGWEDDGDAPTIPEYARVESGRDIVKRNESFHQTLRNLYRTDFSEVADELLEDLPTPD